MARNKEKQIGKLNRLYLENEKEVALRARPKRPHLATLGSADEIKQWLPSIKEDINFNLKQTEVICYSDAKIEEYRNEVDRLQNEYKRFVRKMKQLDSSIEQMPWTNRPYQSKKFKKEDGSSTNETIQKIATPIIDYEVTSSVKIPTEINEGDDVPLQFDPGFSPPAPPPNRALEAAAPVTFSNEEAVQATESKLRKIFGLN